MSTDLWAPSALANISKSVSYAWRKIIYPPSEEFHRWDSSDRAGFKDARKEVVDLLQATYAVIGTELVTTFADLTLSALATSAWLRLEAAAFCLGGLADCGKNDSRLDEALTSVFASPLFSILQAKNTNVHPSVRQACFSLIEQYTDYFERHKSLLGPALRLLFAALHHQSSAVSASKSILRLCSSCRHHLHEEAEAFLHQYATITIEDQLDCVSKERVLGAIAAIVQAVPNPIQRYGACARMLEFLQSDVNLACELAAVQDSQTLPCQCSRCAGTAEPAALHVGLRALRCLVSIGRGLQSPCEGTIDLDSTSLPPDAHTNCLTSLHETIVNVILQSQQLFPKNTDVAELICGVLRCGFSETDPGPFVLPPEAVSLFLTSQSRAMPRIGLFVGTACSFVSSTLCDKAPDRQVLFAAVLNWAVDLMRQLSEPEQDPELAQSGIELATRILVRSPAVVVCLEPADAAESLFSFALKVLDGREPLPKGAATEFWATFLNLRVYNQELQVAFGNAMIAIGPPLAQSLVRNIGGNASRSELDKLCEPVKKLVSRHPLAGEWLQLGMNHSSFPSSRVSSQQKNVFVKKLISLRGSRATNQVVRDFWLSSRGSSFAYAS